MNEEESTKRVLELVEENPGPHDSSSEDVLKGLMNEVTFRNNGNWSEATASDIMKQFEWFMEQARNS